MRGIKHGVVLLTVLMVALVVITFVLENQQGASLSFLGLATGQMPVSVLVIVALIVGMLIGPLLGVLVRNRRHKSISAGRV